MHSKVKVRTFKPTPAQLILHCAYMMFGEDSTWQPVQDTQPHVLCGKQQKPQESRDKAMCTAGQGIALRGCNLLTSLLNRNNVNPLACRCVLKDDSLHKVINHALPGPENTVKILS